MNIYTVYMSCMSKIAAPIISNSFDQTVSNMRNLRSMSPNMGNAFPTRTNKYRKPVNRRAVRTYNSQPSAQQPTKQQPVTSMGTSVAQPNGMGTPAQITQGAQGAQQPQTQPVEQEGVQY